jgi:hypothetical protein
MYDGIVTEQALTEKEQRFLQRQLRYGRAYLYFVVAEILVAGGLLIYMVVIGHFNGTRFALSIVLLLAARGNLKQYKDVILLKKLSQGMRAPE